MKLKQQVQRLKYQYFNTDPPYPTQNGFTHASTVILGNQAESSHGKENLPRDGRKETRKGISV